LAIVWGIELKDSVSVPANAAASAMGEASQQAKALTSAMKSAQSALAKAQALGDVAGVRKAAANFHQFGEALGRLPAPTEEASNKARTFGDSMFGAVFKAELLKDAVEELGKKAFEALKGGFAMAIEASENLKRMTAQFDALGPAGAHAGAATIEALRDIGKEVPQSEAQVASWARSLMATGTIKMDKLREQIKAIASSDALGAVEGAGEATRNVLAKLNETMERGSKTKFTLAKLAPTGLSEADFLKAIGMSAANFEAAKKAGTVTGMQISDAIVKALNIKGKSALDAQMDELGTMATKAKDSFMRLFENVDIAPLADGLKSFFSIFDLANPSGQVLKAGITNTFNVIFKIVGKVFELLRVGFLHLTIWALQALVYLKPLVRQFQEWFKAHDGMNILIKGLKGLGIVLGILVGFFGAIIVTTIGVYAAFTAIGLAIVGAMGWVLGLVPRAAEALVDLASKGIQAGKDLVMGLVNGVEGGVGAAVDAVKNLGKSALDAIRGVFQSHSPSQIMFGIGMGVPGGLAAGIHGGTGQAVAASAHMSTAVVAPVEQSVARAPINDTAKPASRGGGGGAQGGSVSVTIEQFTIEASHAGSPAEMRELVEEGFMSLTERLALMIGAAPEPA
jgi:hypothetical protein